MHIGSAGRLEQCRRLRAGFIGCGSHAFRKGLFLLGQVGEVEEFAQAILQDRPPVKGTLEQAWQVTRIFEAFAEGPGREILL